MWQVIFQIYINDKWLDYCREPSDRKDFEMVQRWAMDQCAAVEKREGKPFRAKYEFWK